MYGRSVQQWHGESNKGGLTFYHGDKSFDNLSHGFVTKFSNPMNKTGGIDPAHL